MQTIREEVERNYEDRIKNLLGDCKMKARQILQYEEAEEVHKEVVRKE
jgi:hypothetical protein